MKHGSFFIACFFSNLRIAQIDLALLDDKRNEKKIVVKHKVAVKIVNNVTAKTVFERVVRGQHQSRGLRYFVLRFSVNLLLCIFYYFMD